MKWWTRCHDLSFLMHANWQNSSTLAESSTKAEDTLGPSWQGNRSTRPLSTCCFQAVTGSKQVCACITQEWKPSLLQPSDKPHWFSNQLRGLIFPVLNSRARCLWLAVAQTSPFPESLWFSPPPLGGLVGVWVLTRSLLLPFYQTPCGSFFTALVVEEPHR